MIHAIHEILQKKDTMVLLARQEGEALIERLQETKG